MRIDEYNTEANRHEIVGWLIRDMAPDEKEAQLIEYLVADLQNDMQLFVAHAKNLGLYEIWEDERLNPY